MKKTNFMLFVVCAFALIAIFAFSGCNAAKDHVPTDQSTVSPSETVANTPAVKENAAENSFSEDALITVEKPHGYYAVYVLDDISVKKLSEDQYELSYTVGTGVAPVQGVSCEYNPSYPYFPILAADEGLETAIDIPCTQLVGMVPYTSDTVKLEEDDIKSDDEAQKSALIGTYLKSSVYVSSFSGTVQTDAPVLYVTTPQLVITDHNLQRREIEKDAYEIDNQIFAESGKIGITFSYERPQFGNPMIGKPRTVALVIDGAEYKSDESIKHGEGEEYIVTYGVDVPEDALSDGNFSVVGYDYQELIPAHVFEIELGER